MIKPTDYRKKRMGAGEVFDGIKAKGRQRSIIESERHAVFTDMLGNGPAVEAGLPVRPNPCTWVDNYVRAHTAEACESKIKKILKDLKVEEAADDPQVRPILRSKTHKKAVTFYRNAKAYFDNHYKKGA